MKKTLLIIAIIFCIFQMVVLATDIDIGVAAIPRGSFFGSGITFVNKGNPANAAGRITSVEIRAYTSLGGCEVATFYNDGNYLSTRDTHYIGSVASGAKRTFTVDLDVEAGDFLGIHYTSGQIFYDSDGIGEWWYAADKIPCDHFFFNFNSTRQLSLYGTGTDLPAQVTNVQATDGDYTDKVRVTWNEASGATKYYVWQGSSWIDVGDVTTWDHTGAPAPTITHGSITASDGTSTAHVALSNTGASANNGSSIDYKVKAWNAAGYGAESSSNSGYRGHGTLNYQWYRSAGDSNASYSSISGATSSTYNDTAAPAPTITKGTVTATDGSYTDKVVLDASGYSTSVGAGRYYKCYHTATGATPGYTGYNRGYRGVGALTRQWQKSAGDSDASYSDISGATSDPYNYTGAPAPTITHGSITASDGTSTAHVALSNTGASANIGAGRWYRAKYTVSGATTQYTAGNRGYRGVGSLTYQWYRSAGDSDASYSVISGATSSTYNDTAAPAGSVPGVPTGLTATDGAHTDKVALAWTNVSGGGGAGRYYKCYHTATGAASGYTGVDRGYRKAYISTNTQVKRDTTELGAIGSLATSYNDTGADAPTITPGTASASNGTSLDYVTLSIAGESADVGTTHDYYVRAYNAAGWGNYCSTNTGYRDVGSLTYQWQRSAGDSDEDYSNIDGATTDPHNDTGAPANGDGRYYKCIENATGTAQQTTNSDRGYRDVVVGWDHKWNTKTISKWNTKEFTKWNGVE